MAKRATAYYLSEDSFGSQNLVIEHSSKSKVTFVSSEGDHVILEGRKFVYQDGALDTGTIDKITITDENDKVLQRIEDFSVSAGSIAGNDATEFFSFLAFQVLSGGTRLLGTNQDNAQLKLFGGNDQIFGKRGNDTIGGGEGRDSLTGGRGSDTFVFLAGDGKDVITDFDADGGEGHQDFINADYGDVLSVHKVGKHDTLIDFGDGDTLTLRDIRPRHIDATDFII